MQRRKFLQYSTLASISSLFNLGLLKHKPIKALPIDVEKNKVYDWIFLYWMPYDNNLSEFSTPILEMLVKGVQSDNILVLVQSNYSGIKPILRNIITIGNIDTQKLEATDSSSEEVFAEYLSWARLQFKAKKWAIVFLGHGGRLDEISPDEHPIMGISLRTKWMNIQKLSIIIEKFNNKINKRVELFFFQNCNKGTLEANYTFKNIAKYTLSSQLTLGAPNYYYEPLLKFVGHNPEINGRKLAEMIMEFDRRDMYYSYTCVNNNAIHSLPSRINPLIESILLSNTKAINLNEVKTYYYMNEQFADAVSCFETLTMQSGVDEQKYNEFSKYLKNSMLVKVKKNGTLIDSDSQREYQNFSGLGVFIPKNKQEIEKYCYLQVYSDLKLRKLFDLILFD